jgi:hypothetical protein
MKTQFINPDQTLLDATKLIIASAKSFKWNRLFLASNFSTDKIGSYLLPLVKQIFRDNFMGSDMEMSMLLIFLKGYFFSAANAARNNMVTELFRKIRKNKAEVIVLKTEKKYNYQQAA